MGIIKDFNGYFSKNVPHKCEVCDKEIKDDKAFCIDKKLIHANDECIWKYAKDNNKTLKNKAPMKLEDAIKQTKKK